MNTKLTSALLVSCGLFAAAPLCHAAVVSYTINSSLSSLRMSGTVGGAPISPQSAGADLDLFSGTITGDLTVATLTLSGGSSIVASANSAGPFVPAPSVAAVDNYGVNVPAFGAGNNIAFRNMIFDLTSGTIVSGAPSAAPFTFTTGIADYDLPAVFGTGVLPLTGADSDNTAAGAATISTSGGIETLTIPVKLSYTQTEGVVLNMDGQIVATRPVPEPGVPLLSLLGLGLLSRRRRRV